MNEEKKVCEHPDHKTHMCYLKAHGQCLTLDDLVGKETFECGICGAKATSVDHICTVAKPFEDEQVA